MDDCRSSNWKQKFIQGLLKYFGQLVMDHIKEKNQGYVNLLNFTHGQILAKIKEVNMKTIIKGKCSII